MPPTRKPLPSLATKKQPAQQRATETYELILDVTAQTLADVGIERLSTNLVCERAGLSPPALYRYFPNKYALLSELGQRLMQRQNERIDHWITLDVFSGGIESLERAVEGLILDTYQVTLETVGGVWIMRALRAVPALQQVRLASHAAVTHEQALLLAKALPKASAAELKLVSRIVVELIYATVEMIFDEPLDVKAVARTVAGMLSSHLTRIKPTAARARPRAARPATPTRR
jgi:AcrR family transcriptional regulator